MTTAVNSLSPEQLRALERAVNGGAVPFKPPTVPNDSGMLRQAPNIPNTAPNASQAQRLLDNLNKQAIPNTAPLPTPNTPIPPVNTAPSLPLSQRVNTALTSPISFPSADRVNNALNKAGGAVAAASVAISVGGSIANAIRKPDANSLAQSAVATASGALLLAPNPYAKAAGLALSVIGSPIVNLWFPSKNNIGVTQVATQGGQSVGVKYYVVVRANFGTSNQVNYFAQGLASGSTDLAGVIAYAKSSGNQFDGAVSGFTVSGTSFSIPTYAVNFIANGQPKQILVAGSIFPVGNVDVNSIAVEVIGRVDGLPDTDQPIPIQLVINDGSDKVNLPFDFDPNAIGDAINRLEDLKNSVNGLSDQNQEILNQLKSIANTPNNTLNQSISLLPNKTPVPPIKPNEPKLGSPSSSSNETVKLPDNSKIQVTGVNVGKDNDTSPTSVLDRLKEQVKQAEQAAQTQSKTQTQTQQDRFKDPKDCQFSCENLAKCFVDLKVKIFDGCNPDTGVAKTKEITIQVLPKDKAKTEASFKELLDMRSRECDLSDRVQTTPEYWATRRGQIPQAIILYKTTTKGENGQPSYYQLQIPHYNGGKNGKPSLPTYQKGEHMAIYECIDGSQMQVYASSDAEALRVINACEKYINPRMRMKDKKNIKTGKRGGMEKVTVKPIRLDFSSTGQARKSAEWSIPL